MNALPSKPGATRRNSSSASTTRQRCDSAHDSSASSTGQPSVPPQAPLEFELMQRQAKQLEEHLKQRLHELDRREAQLHASCAQMESDLRIARMWWLNHEGELREHEQAISVQKEPVGEGGPRIAAAECSAKQNAGSVEDRVTELKALRGNLGHTDQHMAPKEQTPPSSNNDPASQQGKHEPTFHAALQAFAQHSDQLNADQQALAEEREALRQERIHQEATLKHREHQLEEKVSRAARRLWQRRATLTQISKTIAKWREQAMLRHRESLELRLVVEHLYHDLQGAVPAAQLRDKRQALRRQLEEKYDDAKTALKQRRTALDKQARHIHRQQAELEKNRAALLQQADSRRLELEKLTARLVKRQDQLDQSEQSLLRQHRAWQIERQQQRQTIHQLLDTLASGQAPPPDDKLDE